MNRRRGAFRLFKRPDLATLRRALASLRLPRLGHKNRRKLKLFAAGEATPGMPREASEVATPPRSRGRQMLGWALTFLAFAAPLAAAFAAFAMPLLGVRAYEYVMQSGYFNVRQVLVDNAGAPGQSPVEPHLSRSELLTIAGIGAGTHVLDADLEAMTRRLGAHPWIRWAKVERELPDTLVVHVVEHRPSAYLAAGDLYLVDELGVPFALAPADYAAHLPVISGIATERLQDEKEGPAIERELATALNILRTWDSQGLSRRYPVGELRLQGGGGVALVLEGKTAGAATEIVLGQGPFREKLFRLEWVLEHLRSLGKTAEYILLDLGDTSDRKTIDIGGARVVVKTDLPPETTEPAGPVGPAPAGPAPAAGSAPSAPPAPNAPNPSPATPTPPEPDQADEEGAEAAPISGGRPASDDGEE